MPLTAELVFLLKNGDLCITVTRGESNTGLVSAGGDTRQYNCSFQSLIKDWRSQWHSATDGASDPTFVSAQAHSLISGASLTDQMACDFRRLGGSS